MLHRLLVSRLELSVFQDVLSVELMSVKQVEVYHQSITILSSQRVSIVISIGPFVVVAEKGIVLSYQDKSTKDRLGTSTFLGRKTARMTV